MPTPQKEQEQPHLPQLVGCKQHSSETFGLRGRAWRWHVVAVFGLTVTLACAPTLATGGPGGLGPRVQAPVPGESVTSSQQVLPKAASQPQVATDIHVTATDLKFSLDRIQVPTGRPVTLTLDNNGMIQHNIQVEGQDVRVSADPHQSKSTTITFDTPGELTFFCSIPGHKDAGMKGTIVVGNVQPSPLQEQSSSARDESTRRGDGAVQPAPAGLDRLPLPEVAPPVNRTEPATVKVNLETREVTALLADGIAYRYWTFNGTVPGPMVRVRQGDTVELHLANSPEMPATHSINLHAVSGPGGGAWVTQIAPGSDGGFSFKATRPGIYVYHCMTAPVGEHVANGMYGMVVVEPPEGLPAVDHEWYIMEGDFFLKGDRELKGLREFSFDKLMAEQPDYVVFNGSVGALTGERALRAKVGETVRIFFGVGGPASDSAFHVVGGIFDKLHPEGALEALTDVQTTLVPPGGSTMAELKFDAPGHYMIEDHHITRLEKGAMAEIEVEGPDSDVFRAGK